MEEFWVKIHQLDGVRTFWFEGFDLPDEMGTRLRTELFCQGGCGSAGVIVGYGSITVATKESDCDAAIQEALQKVLGVRILLKYRS